VGVKRSAAETGDRFGGKRDKPAAGKKFRRLLY
jgi:hypothetical protein